jgi:hypothetical protein
MTPEPTPEKVPPEVARLITIKYKALPHPSVRWRTLAGRDFQNLLDELEFKYGRAAVAAAAPLTRQGIRAIVDRPPVKDVDAIAYPEAKEIAPLLRGWHHLMDLNAAGRSVRRGSFEHARVARALQPLKAKYDLKIIALATKIPIGRLKKFDY